MRGKILAFFFIISGVRTLDLRTEVSFLPYRFAKLKTKVPGVQNEKRIDGFMRDRNTFISLRRCMVDTDWFLQAKLNKTLFIDYSNLLEPPETNPRIAGVLNSAKSEKFAVFRSERTTAHHNEEVHLPASSRVANHIKENVKLNCGIMYLKNGQRDSSLSTFPAIFSRVGNGWAIFDQEITILSMYNTKIENYNLPEFKCGTPLYCRQKFGGVPFEIIGLIEKRTKSGYHVTLIDDKPLPPFSATTMTSPTLTTTTGVTPATVIDRVSSEAVDQLFGRLVENGPIYSSAIATGMMFDSSTFITIKKCITSTDLEEKLRLNQEFYADWSIYESSNSREGTTSLAGLQDFDNGLAVFKSISSTKINEIEQSRFIAFDFKNQEFYGSSGAALLCFIKASSIADVTIPLEFIYFSVYVLENNQHAIKVMIISENDVDFSSQNCGTPVYCAHREIQTHFKIIGLLDTTPDSGKYTIVKIYGKDKPPKTMSIPTLSTPSATTPTASTTTQTTPFTRWLLQEENNHHQAFGRLFSNNPGTELSVGCNGFIFTDSYRTAAANYGFITLRSCIEQLPDWEQTLRLKYAQVDYSELYSSDKKANMSWFEKRDDDFFTIWISPQEKIDDDVIPVEGEIENAVENELEGMNECFMKQEHPEKRLNNHYLDKKYFLDILNIKLVDVQKLQNEELQFRSKMIDWRSFHFHQTDVGSPIYCPIGKQGEFRIIGLLTDYNIKKLVGPFRLRLIKEFSSPRIKSTTVTTTTMTLPRLPTTTTLEMLVLEENPWESFKFQKFKTTLAPTRPAETTTTEAIDFGEELCCFEMKIESVGADDFGQVGEYNLKKQAVEGQIVFYKRGSGNYLSFERSSRSWTLFVRNHGLFHSEPGETNCPKGMPIKKNGVKVAEVQCASYVPPASPTPPDPRIYLYETFFKGKLKENPETFLLSKLFFFVFSLFIYLFVTTFLI